MKKNILSILALASVLGSGLLVMEGCKLKNPVEGIGITIKPDAVSAANSFVIFDAITGQPDQALEGVSVMVSGPSTPFLYTSDGYQNFKIVNGQIGICLRRGINPTPADPAIFDLTIEAPGYLKRTVHQVLTSLSPVEQRISLISISNLPSNVSKKDTTFVAPSTGLANPIQINSAPKSAVPGITCEVKAGTKFLDQNNNPYVGTVSANMVYSQAGGNTELSTYPLNILSTDLLDSNGAPLNKTFLPGEVVNISFSGGGKALQVVKASDNLTFTKAITSKYSSTLTKNAFNNQTKVVEYEHTLIPGEAEMVSWGSSFEAPKDISISFTNLQNAAYYDFVLEMYHVTGIMINPMLRQGIVPGTNSYTFKGFTPGTYTIWGEPVPLVTRVIATSKINGIQTIFSLTSTSNTIAIPVPAGSIAQYIAKFSVYCNDQSAYMILPENWPVYLIERTIYENKIINDSKGGHKIQPADDPNGEFFLKVLSAKPLEENGINYNLLKIPIGSSKIKENTEYIICTYFGSAGLIFNDFKNPNGAFKTPIGIKSFTGDYWGDVTKMVIDKCGK